MRFLYQSAEYQSRAQRQCEVGHERIPGVQSVRLFYRNPGPEWPHGFVPLAYQAY